MAAHVMDSMRKSKKWIESHVLVFCTRRRLTKHSRQPLSVAFCGQRTMSGRPQEDRNAEATVYLVSFI